MMADFRFSVPGQHIDFRHGMGIVLLRNIGEHPSGEVRMGAFSGKSVPFQEIRKGLIRQKVQCFLGAADPDPAFGKKRGNTLIRIAAVPVQLVGRHLVVDRLAVEIIKKQDILDRQTQSSFLLSHSIPFLSI